MDEYLEFLDWSGRQLRANKRGAIPDKLAPILERLGIEGDELLDTLEDFPQLFRRLVGRAEEIIERAQEVGRRWLHGVRPAISVPKGPSELLAVAGVQTQRTLWRSIHPAHEPCDRLIAATIEHVRPQLPTNAEQRLTFEFCFSEL